METRSKKCPSHWGLWYWEEESRTEMSDLARLDLELTYPILMNKVDESPKIDDNYKDLMRWWMYCSVLINTERKELQRSIAYKDRDDFIDHQRKLRKAKERREKAKIKWLD